MGYLQCHDLCAYAGRIRSAYRPEGIFAGTVSAVSQYREDSGETDEKIRPGLHAYDGSYTELELEWRRIALKIQTAVRDDSLIIRIEPMSNTTRFIPSIVLEGVVLWNMPAVCRKDEQGNRLGCRREDKEAAAHFRVQNDDTYMPVSGPFVSIQLDQAVFQHRREVYAGTGG